MMIKLIQINREQSFVLTLKIVWTIRAYSVKIAV